jgi:hypothetical protein
MFHRRGVWKLFVIGLFGSVALLAMSCSGGASQTELDAAKAQLLEKDKAIAALQAKQAGGATQASPSPAAAGLKFPQYPGATPASIPILGAYANAPVRPAAATPTPLPAGATAPPPPTPIPAPVVTVPLFAHIETVTSGPGESKFNVDANLSCMKTGLFIRGQQIVWRMEVVDTSTGKILTGDDATAKLKLPNGEEVTMRYGRHGTPGTDALTAWFWTAAWTIPMDYPIGTLDYKVTVTAKSGKEMTFGDPLTVRTPNYKGDVALDTRVTIVAPGGG